MISPHTDTGFSGGAKIVLPGVCAKETINAFHTRQIQGPPVRLGDENTALRLELESFVREKVGLDFIFNVVLDADDKVFGAVAGHYVKAHRKGCQMAGKALGIGVDKPFDLVISNAWPNQIDLWQSTKAISSAASIVKPGGNLILLAHAKEGVSNHPLYPVYIGQSPEQLRVTMDRGDSPDPVACALALDISRIKKNVNIHLVSEGLTRKDAGAMGFGWHETLEKAFEDLLDKTRKTRVGIVTHGGICQPFIQYGEKP
jgi:nickel-dependent lactate racemase